MLGTLGIFTLPGGGVLESEKGLYSSSPGGTFLVTCVTDGSLNGLLRSGSANGLLSKSDIAPALRVTHPSPAPRQRRGEAAAPLRAHVAAAAAQIRVQLAGHLAGRATEHARCGGGPRRLAVRLSLPAWICAPGSASDRRASAGGGQVTGPGSLRPSQRGLGKGTRSVGGRWCTQIARGRWGANLESEAETYPPQVPKIPAPTQEPGGVRKRFKTPGPHLGSPNQSLQS